MIREATTKVIEGGSLTRDEAAAAMTEIMEAACTPAQFGAFVTAAPRQRRDGRRDRGMPRRHARQSGACGGQPAGCRYLRHRR